MNPSRTTDFFFPRRAHRIIVGPHAVSRSPVDAAIAQQHGTESGETTGSDNVGWQGEGMIGSPFQPLQAHDSWPISGRAEAQTKCPGSQATHTMGARSPLEGHQLRRAMPTPRAKAGEVEVQARRRRS